MPGRQRHLHSVLLSHSTFSRTARIAGKQSAVESPTCSMIACEGIEKWMPGSQCLRTPLLYCLHEARVAGAQGGASCGVVGRTGSGKSSLMLTLFRLIEVTAGRILLGNVDTASVGLDALRSHLAIIPQARGAAVRNRLSTCGQKRSEYLQQTPRGCAECGPHQFACFSFLRCPGVVVGQGAGTCTCCHLPMQAHARGRTNCASLPVAGAQDPVLFSGSLRSNMDPAGTQPDAALWAALKAVQLGGAVARLGGLDARMAEAGDNLSAGQRQLFCLARRARARSIG